MSDTVDTLVARGDYLAAGRAAADAGDLRRAVQCLERVWRFAEALPLALTLGDRPLAIRLALEARLGLRAAEVARDIPDDDREGLVRAAGAFTGRGHHQHAGDLLMRAERPGDAADAYRRAGALALAARALEAAGRLQEAGRLLERMVDDADPDRPDVAEAQLALARLLSRLGRPLEAARALQRAARHPAARATAQRRLVAELLALGMPYAAEEIARRARITQPGLPEDPHAIAAAERAGDAASEASGGRARFEIRRTLGAGALGRVYEARDQLLGRTVALKVLSVGAGASGPERDAFARFAREAEAAGRLRHPNIVALHELDAAGGLMVLEYLPGGTLADLISRSGPLPPPSVRRLGLELCAGLSSAHRAGIVHRDVKPANVFFDAAGNAKVGDFGAAHLLDFGHTQTGGFIGTLAYLSPEQVTGANIGFAADLYALGATLFEALTGRTPFLGPDLVGQHLAEQPPRPSTLRTGLDPVHDDVVLRALAKAPADRFAAAESMAEALATWPMTGAEPILRKPPALPDAPAPASLPSGPREPLYRTAAGLLVATMDQRVDRRVLVEQRDRPADDSDRVRLRALASVGGAHVQRVLAIAPDGREVTYERIEGEPVIWSGLTPGEAQALGPLLPALAAAGMDIEEPRVVRTDGGLVILVV